MKRTISATIGPMTIAAMIAVASLIVGITWQDGRTASTWRYSEPLPAPTEDATEGPAMVMLVSPTPTSTMIGYVKLSTKTVEPTETTIPACIEGIATPNALCRETAPTWTPVVWTPIAIYGTVSPVTGQLYFWQDGD